MTRLTLIAALTVAGTAVAQITYLDATVGPGGNTTLADGSEYNPPINGTTGLDNQWELRTGLANNSSVLAANDEGGAIEDAPRLRTTITGLNPGTSYEIYAYFWGAANAVKWQGRAGLENTVDPLTRWLTNPSPSDVGTPATPVASNNQGTNGGNPPSAGGLPDASGFESTGLFTGSVLIRQSDRDLYQAPLGTAVANASGEIAVYIDDSELRSTVNERTWYDGVGYAEIVPVPCSPADLAEPYQVLNVFDILAFFDLFSQGCGA